MNKMLDINRTALDDILGKCFTLNGSDHKFMEMSDLHDEYFIVDLTASKIYTVLDVACGVDGFSFFSDEKDDDFLGVLILDEEA